jgi:taurine dioxygenase
MPTPARATLLYAIEVPEEGGATQFADMYAGLQAFDEVERRRLETLEVIHDVELSRVLRFGRAISVNKHLGRRQKLRRWLRFMRRTLPGRATVHPVIRTNNDSGRPAIVLGCDAWRIRGMGWRRGMREVAELTQRSVRPERVLTHCWQAGDVVVWDNRSLLHRVNDYNFKREARVMRQVVIVERTT